MVSADGVNVSVFGCTVVSADGVSVSVFEDTLWFQLMAST